VPARRPELGNRRGEIWAPEVLHQVEAKNLGRADGHVRIPRKVAVQLEGKEVRGNPKVRWRREGRLAVGRVDNQGQPIGNDHFLDESPQEKLQPLGRPLMTEPNRLPKRLEEPASPLDRASQQLWKKGEVGREVADVSLSIQTSGVHVRQITDARQRIKRKADRCARRFHVLHRGENRDNRRH
jgi:hypothetical protein